MNFTVDAAPGVEVVHRSYLEELFVGLEKIVLGADVLARYHRVEVWFLPDDDVRVLEGLHQLCCHFRMEFPHLEQFFLDEIDVLPHEVFVVLETLRFDVLAGIHSLFNVPFLLPLDHAKRFTA